MQISVYTFEDADSNEFGSYQTQKAEEAKEYAQANKLRVIENVLVFEESMPVTDWDFTQSNDED